MVQKSQVVWLTNKVNHSEIPFWLQIPTPILLYIYGPLASGFLLVTEKIDEKA